jgi:Leucine-rich repeat (LRR) protein
MKTLPNDIILEIASFGLHKEIRLLDKWFNNKIPKEHCIYRHRGDHKDLKRFVNLTHLRCWDTNISEIPRELVNLTTLNCSDTNISEIPRELVNLTYLDCRSTNISEIPRELVNLTVLYCWSTNISEIPRELVNLTNLLH